MPDGVMQRLGQMEVLDLLETAEWEASHGTEAHRAMWHDVEKVFRREANARWKGGPRGL